MGARPSRFSSLLLPTQSQGLGRVAPSSPPAPNLGLSFLFHRGLRGVGKTGAASACTATETSVRREPCARTSPLRDDGTPAAGSPGGVGDAARHPRPSVTRWEQSKRRAAARLPCPFQ